MKLGFVIFALVLISNCIISLEDIKILSDSQVRNNYKKIYNSCPDVALSIPCVIPIYEVTKVNINSLYGFRKHPIYNVVKHHDGIDIAVEPVKVYSTANGVIKKARFSRTYGNYVEIDHLNGYSTLYAHLSSNNVIEGDTIAIGTNIGIVGRTGAVTGYHLHYEIRKNNQLVNPINYLLLLYYAHLESYTVK